MLQSTVKLDTTRTQYTWEGFFLLQAFSISEIATAYCDEGQNYKNLVGYVKGLSKSIINHIYNYSAVPLFVPVDVKYDMKIDFGCISPK